MPCKVSVVLVDGTVPESEGGGRERSEGRGAPLSPATHLCFPSPGSPGRWGWGWAGTAQGRPLIHGHQSPGLQSPVCQQECGFDRGPLSCGLEGVGWLHEVRGMRVLGTRLLCCGGHISGASTDMSQQALRLPWAPKEKFWGYPMLRSGLVVPQLATLRECLGGES